MTERDEFDDGAEGRGRLKSRYGTRVSDILSPRMRSVVISHDEHTDPLHVWHAEGDSAQNDIDVHAYPLTLEELERAKQIDGLVEERVAALRKQQAALLVRVTGELFGATEALFSSRRARIASPPGHAALEVLRFLFPKRAYTAVFGQMVADERDQHSEALAAGDRRLAAWISVRLNCSLGLAAVFYCFATIGQKLVSIWKAGT